MATKYVNSRHLLQGISTVAMLLVGASAIASDIADAAMNNDYDSVFSLIDKGVDVNEQQIDGQTALHWAVVANETEVVQKLIEAGADVNAKNRTNATPLMLAAINGAPQIIQLLLDQGADPNERVTLTNDTVLMLAARTGVPKAVELLLDYGAEVNERETWSNSTALMWAASEGHVEVVSMLIDHGADIDAKSLYQPQDNIATYSGFQGQNPRERHPYESGPMPWSSGELTAMLYAAREGHLPVVRQLVGSGADINVMAADGQNGISLAITNGHFDIASYLIEKGANVNQQGAQGFTPLYWAVEARNMEVAPGFPWLVTEDTLPLMRQMLEAGADPNLLVNSVTRARMQEGTPLVLYSTALARAAFSGDLESSKLLLEFGADPHIKSAENESILSLAAGSGFIMGYHKWRPITERLEVIRLLVDEYGLDVNNYDNYGLTPLMMAANLGDVEIIKYLLDKGAQLDDHDLGTKNTNGTEPLMPLDYALGIGTFRPNRTVVYNREAAEFMIAMMEEKGIKHTTSECTLRGFTCTQSDMDAGNASPADIMRGRIFHTGL